MAVTAVAVGSTAAAVAVGSTVAVAVGSTVVVVMAAVGSTAGSQIPSAIFDKSARSREVAEITARSPF